MTCKITHLLCVLRLWFVPRWLTSRHTHIAQRPAYMVSLARWTKTQEWRYYWRAMHSLEGRWGMDVQTRCDISKTGASSGSRAISAVAELLVTLTYVTLLDSIPLTFNWVKRSMFTLTLTQVMNLVLWTNLGLLGRPTYLSADLGFTAILYSIQADLSRPLSSFFVCYLRSSLNGTQPKPATCSEVSAIWRRMSEMWGSRSHNKWEAQKGKNHFSRRLYNLTAAQRPIGLRIETR